VTCIEATRWRGRARAGPALAIAAIGSFAAGTFGTLLIAVAGPPLAELALKFGAPEYFSLMLMAWFAAAVLAQGDILKSLAMVVMGLLLGIVGTDVNTGVQRFSFGVTELSDGIGFIVVASACLPSVEIIANLGDRKSARSSTEKVKNLMPTREDLKASGRPDHGGTLLGSFFACCPAQARPSHRSRPTWWKRSLRKTRRASAEAPLRASRDRSRPTNADAQCKFIPMLTLGLPASGVMALMLGALTIQGIQPGPEVMTTRPELFWAWLPACGSAMRCWWFSTCR